MRGDTKKNHHTFQQLSGKFQHGRHLGAGLPLAVLEHSETHGAAVGRVVIADVGVVDLGGKGDGRGLERVGWWKGDVESEDTALVICVRDVDSQPVGAIFAHHKKRPEVLECLSGGEVLMTLTAGPRETEIAPPRR